MRTRSLPNYTPETTARSHPRFPSAKNREIRRKIKKLFNFAHSCRISGHSVFYEKNTLFPTNTICLAISEASGSSPRHTKVGPNEQKKPPLFFFPFLFDSIYLRSSFSGGFESKPTSTLLLIAEQVPKEIRGSRAFLSNRLWQRKRPARLEFTNLLSLLSFCEILFGFRVTFVHEKSVERWGLLYYSSTFHFPSLKKQKCKTRTSGKLHDELSI